MKTIFLLLTATLFTFSTNAQDLPTDEEGNVVYSGVVTLEGKSQKELMKNATSFFDAEYKSAKNRVVEGSSIMDNHNFIVKKGKKDAGGVNYEIRVMIKDGRYKYEISNLVHKDYAKTVGTGGKFEREEPKDGFSQSLWIDIKNQANEQALALIERLKEAMAYTEEKKSDDW